MALGPSALLYWVILWVAAPVFPQGCHSCENLMTLQTEQGYVFAGEGPYLWRNIVWVVNESQDSPVRAKGSC